MNHEINYWIVLTSTSYHVVWFLNLEKILSQCLSLQWLWLMVETLKWLYIPYGLIHHWLILITIDILNKGTIISHGIEIMCPPWVILRNFDHKIYGIIVILKWNLRYVICELEYVNWLQNKWFET